MTEAIKNMKDMFLNMLEYFRQTCLFIFGEASIEHLNYPYLVFFISTSAIGLLCVTLDFAYYKTSKGKSIFKLSYIEGESTFLVFLFWGIGAGIVGFLASRLELIAFSIQASITIGLGWPLMFPRIYEYSKSNMSELEPYESTTTEIEDESIEVDSSVESEDVDIPTDTEDSAEYSVDESMCNNEQSER